LVIFTVAVAANATDTAPKRVLLVYQNDGYSPAALEFQQGVLARLREGLGRNFEFYSEQLQSARLPESRELALSLIRARYAAHGIGVVFFLGAVPTDIPPGVPVVYVGNSPSELLNRRFDLENSVAIWFKTEVKKTISAARELQPTAKNVLIISGSEANDLIYLREISAQLRESDIHLEYLTDATVDELLVRVAHLPRDTIVLPISYTRDRNGKSYYSADVMASLSRASTAPLYALSDTYIGAGAVGGSVVDYSRAGKVAADVGLQILAGKTAKQAIIPPVDITAYVFDWRQLKRWGFFEKDLPEGSIVRFRTPTAWEQYRWRIVGAIALVVAQFILILSLLAAQRKRFLAEASLRDMTGRLLASQDDERRRFARDLHDGTGQHLSAVALIIGQVLAEFPRGHEVLRKLLQESHLASRQALDEVRTVSFALHPPLLDNLGLVAAVRWYLDGLQKRTNLSIDFDAPQEVKHLAPEAERALFRIVQESVGNVLRHSGGNRISVVLSNREKAVTLEIKDNGHGLSSEQLAQAEGTAIPGVGIYGMRERLRQLDGIFKIQSSEKGTTVVATVPVEEERYASNSPGPS
jgi:signal transduction histidine kinase